jgi:hypothetical protein
VHANLTNASVAGRLFTNNAAFVAGLAAAARRYVLAAATIIAVIASAQYFELDRVAGIDWVRVVKCDGLPTCRFLNVIDDDDFRGGREFMNGSVLSLGMCVRSCCMDSFWLDGC